MSTSQTLEVPGFQVVQYLGSGARSTIWQIRESQTNKLFALKRVVKRSVNDVRFLEQAINEFEVASRFEHPVIRRVFSMRRIKHWLSLREIHLIMEMCEGQTIQDNPPTTFLDAIDIFVQVAEGLAYMNAHGFVHSDMKPNNIIVGADAKVKIIDLGQSCPIGTVKTRIQGTPDFIAPEQVHRRPLDARTDVYNFGAALYWTLVRKPIPTVLPKKGQHMTITDLNVTPPDEANPSVPSPLSKMVMDCIELRPSKRPDSMQDIASRLSLIGHTLRMPSKE